MLFSVPFIFASSNEYYYIFTLQNDYIVRDKYPGILRNL